MPNQNEIVVQGFLNGQSIQSLAESENITQSKVKNIIFHQLIKDNKSSLNKERVKSFILKLKQSN